MFGYVTVNQDELKMKDYRRYRSFYCGLCRSLKTRYGKRGQSFLPYDMVFLNILLNGLYEEPLEEKDARCALHPLHRQHFVYNDITDYTADMGVLLMYYKLLDDSLDDRSLTAAASASLLKRAAHRAREAWPEQGEAVRSYVESLKKYEQGEIYNLDETAGLSGTALGALFVMKEGEWSEELRRTGFYLGKFVYLMDALDDLERDQKKGQYNPWMPFRERKDFDALAENTLTMMMAECARHFERLPIVQDIDILRNILYSGVWQRYAIWKKKREKADEEKL